MAILSKGQTFANADSITSTKLNNLVDAATFVAGSSGTTDNASLEVNGSGRLQVKDLGVTSAKLAIDSVTTAKIFDLNVTTAKIADSNVTTAKIADSNVTTAKIADSNVTTAKIADAAVTATKIAHSNFPIQIVQAVKTDIQTISGTASAFNDVTGLSITLTRVNASASGKIRVQANISTTTNNGNHGVILRIMRDSTPIGLGDASGIRIQATSNTGYNGAYGNESGVIDFIDSSPGSAATVTYKIQAKMYSAATGYINRVNTDDNSSDYTPRTISTLTLTELTP